MLIVILLFGLFLIWLSYFIYSKKESEGYYSSYDECFEVVLCVFAGIVSFAALIGIIAMGISLINCRTINQKIDYLYENNEQVEEKLYYSLQQYCEYENKTFTEISPDNPEVLFMIYPELKSDTLFVSYMDTIVDNNAQIKELKLEQINAATYKWWLYFGGN